MRMIRIIGICALLSASAARAAPAPGAVPPAETSWSGWTAGGHFGFVDGSAATRLSSPATPVASTGFDTLLGGLQLGYARTVGAGAILGLEGDVSFPNFLDGNDRIARVASPDVAVEERLDATGTLRARVGHVLGRSLVYGTAGLAWGRGRFLAGDGAEAPERTRGGWTVGAGVALPVAPAWTLRLEYSYAQLARTSADLAGGVSSSAGFHGLSVGFDWHASSRRSDSAADPGEADAAATAAGPAPVRAAAAAPVLQPLAPGPGAARRDVGGQAEAGDEPWLSVHGQSTVVVQGYPAFRSPYAGENSLSGRGQVQNTVSATAFLGARPWSGAELYVNPELMQGFGLSDTRGVAGFPNGEAQRSNFPVPRFNLARMYVSQVFGLGDTQERVEDGPNQLAGERSVSRLTLTAGKLAVTDFFLVNSYAGEPRTGFLNWNVYGGGSYDWTMDLLSWTWGALAELNQPRWAARAGYFLLPAVSNTNRFDLDVPRNGQWTGELEVRHAAFGRPGKVQLFGWLSHGNIGSYPAALAAAPAGTPPDIVSTRGRDRYNYGFVVSVEQPVTDDLGLFARASWSPEEGETMGWTDCGQSLSFGGVLRGGAWHRPDDAVGVALLIEGLSPVARRYFEAGGLGTIVGDGAMTYRPEQVIETYYTVGQGRGTALTLDHQLVVNPGYNADRGPVSVWAVRLHAAF